jgi:hypothetical protein
LLISKRTLHHLLPSLCLWLFACAAVAATITGTVTNRTTGKPSAGDTIAVINTAQSMDEIAKVTSDSSGSFHVSVPDGGQILLHVTHKGAEYFKSVQPGTSSVDIDVYDSAPKISGITGEALVLRAETDPTGKLLEVSENFFVQNASTPPKTEFGGNTFDFFLPKGAEVTESLASAPGGLPTNVKVVPVDAATGHYAFTFPVRPGENRFQVVYTLPYTGKQPFTLKLSVPTGDVAVMLPKTMQFDGGAQFQPISPDPNSQSYDAHNPVFSQPVVFMISGAGQLPQNPEGSQGAAGNGGQGSGDQPAGAATTTASGSRPGGGMAPPGDPEGTNDPWAKYKWWILGLLGLALAGGAGVMLKSNPGPAVALPAAEPTGDITAPPGAYFAPSAVPVAPPVSSGNSLLQALKDELFELETDRLAGKLTPEQYADHKAAFDVVLRRVLSRLETADRPAI